jgi:hypothetical protein
MMRTQPKVPNARVYAVFVLDIVALWLITSIGIASPAVAGLCQNSWCVSIISMANHLSLLHIQVL